jgi:hypothetical protein
MSQPEIDAVLSKPAYGPGEGVPAGPDVAAEIRALLTQQIACGDSDHIAEYFSSYSTDFLGTYLVFEDSSYAEFLSGSTFPPISDVLPAIAVWDVRVQPDGRVTAKIEYAGDAEFVTFVNTDGRWQIDEIFRYAIIEPAPESAF